MLYFAGEGGRVSQTGEVVSADAYSIVQDPRKLVGKEAQFLRRKKLSDGELRRWKQDRRKLEWVGCLVTFQNSSTVVPLESMGPKKFPKFEPFPVERSKHLPCMVGLTH